MQLTRHTDFALRLLLYLGTRRDGLVTISEASERLMISRNHLMKIVNQLSVGGFIETIRGKGGGMRLALHPQAIGIGKVVRHCERNLQLVDCESPSCPLQGHCRLVGVLDEAVEAFMSVLDKYSLQDLMGQKVLLEKLFQSVQPSAETL